VEEHEPLAPLQGDRLDPIPDGTGADEVGVRGGRFEQGELAVRLVLRNGALPELLLLSIREFSHAGARIAPGQGSTGRTSVSGGSVYGTTRRKTAAPATSSIG